MTTGAAQWSLAIGASVLAHLAVAAVLALTLAPEPVPHAAGPQSRLDLSSDPIERIAARPQQPEAEAAAEGRAETASLPAGVVPMGRAAPVAASGEALAAATAPALPLAGRDAAGEPLSGADLPAQPATAAEPAPGDAVSAAAPPDARIAAADPDAEAATAVAPPDATPALSAAPDAQRITTAEAAPDRLAASAPEAVAAATVPPAPDTALALAAPAAERLAASPTPAASAVVAPVPAMPGLAAALPAAERLATAPAGSVAIAAAAPDTAVAPPAAPAPERLAGATAEAPPAVVAPADAQRLASAPAPADNVPVAAPDAEVAAPAAAAAERLTSATSDAAALAAAPPEGLAQLSPAVFTAESLGGSAPGDLALVAFAAPVIGERAQAALAWTGDGDGDGPIDPVSLAAIQSFMQPADLARLDAGRDPVRDGISALLAAVPCARMQTVFLPETGALELRGHVPEEGLRDPVLAALRGQVGSAIPVTDNLRILPRPQCDVLSGIAALGLPQSTVQETDPRLVGADAHAREYAYVEGDELTFEVTTPDYPAHVYIDYFDADGMVLHLQPNELLDTALMAPKSTLHVGQTPEGEEVFEITVAPPFGNEIAVAFAASRPIHDAPRPVREPAGPYLDWLRERIAAARAADPDFKGEWVYFFMSTAPAGR